jgi:hypothetical protein
LGLIEEQFGHGLSERAGYVLDWIRVWKRSWMCEWLPNKSNHEVPMVTATFPGQRLFAFARSYRALRRR